MIVDEVLAAVFPHLGPVEVDAVERRGRIVRLVAHTRSCAVPCPSCGAFSQRVHGRYVRRLSDVAVGGCEVLVALTVRRMTCEQRDCPRRTFTEQIPDLVDRYQRRTRLLTRVLQIVATALAGRAGARLADRLQIAVSRSTLLRLLASIPEPAVGELTAVGIDDFAFRRGHVYGTVVIDMLTHRPVDVLPDRAAETVTDWLLAHPGIQILCRDRAGAYAEAARTGCPTATEVADRWHLYKNLADTVEKIVRRHRRDLAESTTHSLPENQEPTEADASHQDPGPEPDTDAGDEPARGALATRIIERFTAVHDLLAAGQTRTQVSRILGLDPHTVRRYATATATDVDQLLNPRRTYAAILDPFKDHLHRRWSDGVTNAEELHREITALGYRGSSKSVRRYLHPLRAHLDADNPTPTPPAPSVRELTRWLTCKPDALTDRDTSTLTGITSRCPALADVQDLVRDFATMLLNRHGTRLQAWLARADASPEPELRAFATGLRKDLDAVTAGLTLPHSSGPVEGNVNRIKMIKRQMYGRAGFPLLRRRILLPN